MEPIAFFILQFLWFVLAWCPRSPPLVATHTGNVTEVVLGSIDGDPGVRPGEHILVGSKARGHEISDALPRFEEWPPDPRP